MVRSWDPDLGSLLRNVTDGAVDCLPATIENDAQPLQHVHADRLAMFLLMRTIGNRFGVFAIGATDLLLRAIGTSATGAMRT